MANNGKKPPNSNKKCNLCTLLLTHNALSYDCFCVTKQTNIQSAYAASKANDKAQKAADEYEAAQRARLDAAENAVQIWLQRVKKEQAAVQQAVEDLAAAQAEMGGKTDGLSKLRAGGLPKQMAVVGAVLFSVRSIIDTIGSLTDPSLQSAALIQGAIAVACAIYLFFL